MTIKNLNKTAQGIVSFATIVILLVSVLASSIYFEYSITANAVKETAINTKPTITIKEVKDINKLNYLNEGWYEIKNGYVYYLESFNDYVPLYIQVINPQQQNGLMVIYADGEILFDESFRGSSRSQFVADEKEDKNSDEESTQNQITGKVTGMERVSGFNVLQGLNQYISEVKKQQTSGTVTQGNKNFVLVDSSNHIVKIPDVKDQDAILATLRKELNQEQLRGISLYSVDKNTLGRIQDIDSNTGLIKVNYPGTNAMYYNPKEKKYLNSEQNPIMEVKSQTIQKGVQQLEVFIENNLETKKSKIEVYAPDGSSLTSLEVPTQLTSTTLQRIKSDYTIASDAIKKTITFSKTTNLDKPNQKIETIISYEDGKTETTIQEGTGDKSKVTRTVEFADKSQVTKQYKGEEGIGNIEKVIVTTKEGKKLELGNEQYTNTVGAIANSIGKSITEVSEITDKFLQIAAKEGFAKVEFKEGRLR